MLAIGAVLLMMATFIVGTGDRAQAAVSPGYAGPGITLANYYSYGTYRDKWVGPWQSSHTPGLVAPSGLGWCIEFGEDQGAVTGGVMTYPAVAYLLQAHEAQADATSRAAIATALWMYGFPNQPGMDSRFPTRMQAEHADAWSLAAQWWSEAQAYAGPYTSGVGPASMQLDVDLRGGTVSGIGVLSAAPNWTPGATWTLTLVGPAVWDATGTAALTGTTTTSPQSAHFTATGPGHIYAVFSATGLASSAVYSGVSATYQDMIARGETVGVSAVTNTHAEQMDFQPEATSAVADKVAAGGVLTDRLTVSAAGADSWQITLAGAYVPVVFRGTAYAVGSQPIAPTSTIPADATVIGTTTFTANGPGVYTPSIPAGAPGIGSWRWEVRAEDQDPAVATYIRPWADQLGQPAETFSVPHTAASSSTASVSLTATVDGDVRRSPVGLLSDEVTISGLPADHPNFAGGGGFAADAQTVTHSLYFFPEGEAVTDANLGAAELIASTTTPAANGRYTISGPAFTQKFLSTGANVPGTYVFTSSFAGDDRVSAFTSSVTDVDEQVTVTARPVQLASTATSTGPVMIGSPIDVSDAATVWGDIPEGSTVTFDLYTWPQGTTPVCTTPLFTSPAIDVDQEGTIDSPTYTVPKVTGDLGWVVTLSALDGSVLAQGACGEESETLGSLRPVVVTTTAAASTSVVVGSPVDVRDTATITGDVPAGTTITFALYTWTRGGTPVCTTPLFTSPQIPVTHEGDTASPTFTVTKVTGDLGWVETTTTATGKVLSQGTCGDAPETLLSKAGVVQASVSRAGLARTGAGVIGTLGTAASLAALGWLLMAIRRREGVIASR